MIDRLNKSITLLEQIGIVATPLNSFEHLPHVPSSSSMQERTGRNSRSFARELMACKELRQVLTSWDMDGISKHELARAISILFILIDHSEQSIRFMADQTLDAIFRRLQLKFQPQRVIAFILAQLEKDGVPARTICAALQKLSHCIHLYREHRASIYALHFLNAICLCIQRVDEEIVQQSINNHFPTIFNFLGKYVGESHAEKAEELFNSALSNFDVPGASTISVISSLAHHVPALLHKSFYKLSNIILEADIKENKTRIFNALRAFRLLWAEYCENLNDSLLLILQKVLCRSLELSFTNLNELLVPSLELLIEAANNDHTSVKLFDFDPSTLFNTLNETYPLEELNIEIDTNNSHTESKFDPIALSELVSSVSPCSANSRATTSNWGSISDIFDFQISPKSVKKQKQATLTLTLSARENLSTKPNKSSLRRNSSSSSSFSFNRGSQSFRTSDSIGSFSFDTGSNESYEYEMDDDNDKFSIISSDVAVEPQIFDPLLNCPFDASGISTNSDDLPISITRKKSGSVTPTLSRSYSTEANFTPKNERKNFLELLYRPEYLCGHKMDSFWHFSVMCIVRQFLLSNEGVQHSDKDVRVSHKIIALNYITSAVQRQPEITNLHLIHRDGSPQYLTELYAFISHDDDQLAVAALSFAFTVNINLKIWSVFLKSNYDNDKLLWLLKRAISLAGEHRSTSRLKSIFQLLTYSIYILYSDHQLFSYVCEMILSSSHIDYFLFKVVRIEFLSKIKWYKVCDNLRRQYQEPCFKLILDGIFETDSRIQRTTLSSLADIVCNAYFGSDESLMVFLEVLDKNWIKQTHAHEPSSISLIADVSECFVILSNRLRQRSNPPLFIEMNLAYLIRAIYFRSMQGFVNDGETSFVYALASLSEAFPPSSYNMAWLLCSNDIKKRDREGGILGVQISDILALLLECSDSGSLSIGAFTALFRTITAILSATLEISLVRANLEPENSLKSDSLSSKPISTIYKSNAKLFDQILLLHIRTINLCYALVTEERHSTMSGSIQHMGSSTASGILTATSSFLVKTNKRMFNGMETETDIVADDTHTHLASVNDPTHNARNLSSQLFVNGVNIQKNPETSFTRSLGLKTIEAALRGAYRSFIDSLSSGDSQRRFSEFLSAILNGFVTILEMIDYKKLAIFLDEILLYLRAIMDTLPALSVKFVHQLLKSIFGINAIHLTPGIFTFEEDNNREHDCSVNSLRQNLINSTGWLYFSLQNAETSQFSPNELTAMLSKFEPFITHLIRVYPNTKHVDAKKGILRCLSTLSMNHVKYDLLDRNFKFYGKVLFQVKNLTQEDVPLLPEIFTFLRILKRIGIVKAGDTEDLLAKLFEKLGESNGVSILDSCQIVLLELLASYINAMESNQSQESSEEFFNLLAFFKNQFLRRASYLFHEFPIHATKLFSIYLQSVRFVCETLHDHEQDCWEKVSCEFFLAYHSYCMDTEKNSPIPQIFDHQKYTSARLQLILCDLFNHSAKIPKNKVFSCLHSLLEMFSSQLNLVPKKSFLEPSDLNHIMTEKMLMQVSTYISILLNTENFEPNKKLAESDLLSDTSIDLISHKIVAIIIESTYKIHYLNEMSLFAHARKRRSSVHFQQHDEQILAFILKLVLYSGSSKFSDLIKGRLYDYLKGTDGKAAVKIILEDLSIFASEACVFWIKFSINFNILDALEFGGRCSAYTNAPNFIKLLTRKEKSPVIISQGTTSKESQNLEINLSCHAVQNVPDESTSIATDFYLHFAENSNSVEHFDHLASILLTNIFSPDQLRQMFGKINERFYTIFLRRFFYTIKRTTLLLMSQTLNKTSKEIAEKLAPIKTIIDSLILFELCRYTPSTAHKTSSDDFISPKINNERKFLDEVKKQNDYTIFVFAELLDLIKITSRHLSFPEFPQFFGSEISIDRLFNNIFMPFLVKNSVVAREGHQIMTDFFKSLELFFTLPSVYNRHNMADEIGSLRSIYPFISRLWETIELTIPTYKRLATKRWSINVSINFDEQSSPEDIDALKDDVVGTFYVLQGMIYSIRSNLIIRTDVIDCIRTIIHSISYLHRMSLAPESALRNGWKLSIALSLDTSNRARNRKMSLCISVPLINIHLLNEPQILHDFCWRISWLGWTSKSQFEEFWMTLYGVVASSTPITCVELDEKISTDGMGSAQQQVQVSCHAIEALTNLLIQTTLYPTPGNPSNSIFKIKTLRRINDYPFFSHTDLFYAKILTHQLMFNNSEKITWDRQFFTLDQNLERIGTGSSSRYCFGQLSVYHLLEKANMLVSATTDSTFSKDSSLSTNKVDDIIENANVNPFLPLQQMKIEVDITSSIRALVDTYVHWFSIDYLQTELMVVTLKSLTLLSDLFDSVVFWHELFSSIRSLYSSRYLDGNPLARGYAILLIMKSLAILNWEELDISESSLHKLLDQLIKTGLSHKQSCRKPGNSFSLTSFTRVCTLHGIQYLLQSSLNAQSLNPNISYIMEFIISEIEHLRSENHLPTNPLKYYQIVWSVAFALIEDNTERLNGGKVDSLRERLLDLISKKFTDPKLHTWEKKRLTEDINLHLVISNSSSAPFFKQIALECFETYQLRPEHLPFTLSIYFTCAIRQLNGDNETSYLFNKNFPDEFQKLLNIFMFYANQNNQARIYADLIARLVSLVWCKELLLQNIWTMIAPSFKQILSNRKCSKSKLSAEANNKPKAERKIIFPANNNEFEEEERKLTYDLPLTMEVLSGDQHNEEKALDDIEFELTQFDQSLFYLFHRVLVCMTENCEQRRSALEIVLNSIFPQLNKLYEPSLYSCALTKCLYLLLLSSISSSELDHQIAYFIIRSKPSIESIPKAMTKCLIDSFLREISSFQYDESSLDANVLSTDLQRIIFS